MDSQVRSGTAPIHGVNIYYEIAGTGQPFVMVHAGVADSRQWNHEFRHFAQQYQVIRYDQRGFGRSEPTVGSYSFANDLTALLAYLNVQQPVILMGCSMGGSMAMDFTLAHPERVKALIMVGAGPSGLALDVQDPPIFQEIEQAFNAGNYDKVAELDMLGWLVGVGRSPEQIDPELRTLFYEMDRTALAHEATYLGKNQPLPNPNPAAGRLNELHVPVLAVIGEYDVPYMHHAAQYMREHIPSMQYAFMHDAAHLPNMEHPEEFQRIVTDFLSQIDR